MGRLLCRCTGRPRRVGGVRRAGGCWYWHHCRSLRRSTCGYEPNCRSNRLRPDSGRRSEHASTARYHPPDNTPSDYARHRGPNFLLQSTVSFVNSLADTHPGHFEACSASSLLRSLKMSVLMSEALHVTLDPSHQREPGSRCASCSEASFHV